MAIYAVIDLLSNSNFLSAIDSAGEIIDKLKFANDVQAILHPLAACRDQLQGIAIESTFKLVLDRRCFDGRGVSGAFGESRGYPEVLRVQAQ